MSRPAAKLRSVPSAPGDTSRPAHHSAATKRALIEVAEVLFAEQGYPATSLDQIVAAARVTKGALYHHFSGKRALFEVVLERIEDKACTSIQAGVEGECDPWRRARAGLRTFLDVVQQPTYRRIVIQDGSSVLGYERFREHGERSAFATVVEIMRGVLTAGAWDLDEEMLQAFASIFFGAMSSAGESVASSDDPDLAAQRVETALGFILTGLQSLADAGVPIPDPAGPGIDG